MAIISRSCERARSWVSLDLDDELSELEGAVLRAHTARCVPCAQFQSEAVAITHKLRLAPLEPLPAPIALPPRRRVVGRLLQVGAAAAVAALAAGIGALLPTSPQPPNLTAPVGKPTAEPSSRFRTSMRRRACHSIRRSRSGRASGSIRAAPTSNIPAVRPVALLLGPS